MQKKSSKIIVAISGASGALYAKQLIDYLLKEDVELRIIATDNGKRIFGEEIGTPLAKMDYPLVSNKTYNVPFVSGSAVFDKMVIVPASMGCIARIASGLASDTISRSADVFLKEQKKLIVVPRETPFSLIHLENLKRLSLCGAQIIPANPSFYSLPQTIDELAQTVTSRILDHLEIPNKLSSRWQTSC